MKPHVIHSPDKESKPVSKYDYLFTKETERIILKAFKQCILKTLIIVNTDKL